MRHRNKRPHLGVGKKSLARLKISRARQKILRPRHKIFKRVVGDSWDAWKFRGRASFAIFPIEIFSQNFGCGHVRHQKKFSEKIFFPRAKVGGYPLSPETRMRSAHLMPGRVAMLGGSVHLCFGGEGVCQFHFQLFQRWKECM